MGGLTLWSFLMASAQGAGLMVLPVFLSMTVVAGGPSCHARGASTQAFAGAMATLVHGLGYLAVTALIAWFVVDRLGLGLLRKAWINLDAIRAPCGCETMVHETGARFSLNWSRMPQAKEFQKCIGRYQGGSRFRGFSCWDQYLATAFTQLTYRESLREIEACLRSMSGKLYHMGFRGRLARSTLTDANEYHDWHIYVDFERLYVFTLSAAFFVVRSKWNLVLQWRYSHLVDKSTGVRCDHRVILTAIDPAKAYPDPLRRVSYLDAQSRKRIKLLTNNFSLPALPIARVYQQMDQNSTCGSKPSTGPARRR